MTMHRRHGVQAAWASLVITRSEVRSDVRFVQFRALDEMLRDEANILCDLAGQVRSICNSDDDILSASLFFGSPRYANARWFWGGRTRRYEWIPTRQVPLEVRFGAMGQFVVRRDTEETLAVSSL